MVKLSPQNFNQFLVPSLERQVEVPEKVSSARNLLKHE